MTKVPFMNMLSKGVVVTDSAVPLLHLLLPEQLRSLFYTGRALPVFVCYMVKRAQIGLVKEEQRAAQWASFHEFGAAKAAEVVADFQGFYVKGAQVMGGAAQMMPEAYVRVFSKTLDHNAPVAFEQITKTIEASLGGSMSEVFESVDVAPVATASVAQVHFGVLKDKREVAVKVQICAKRRMLSDVRNMRSTAVLLKAVGMDGGMDLPTIAKAYLDVLGDEFDFRVEAEKLKRFAKVFEEANLSDKIALPAPVDDATGEKLLVMTKLGGETLSELLAPAPEGSAPACPAAAAALHVPAKPLPGGGTSEWEGVFNTLFLAWGHMMLVEGTFHTDPHPGNILLLPDGRLGLLDFGQTKTLKEADRKYLCRLILAIADDNDRVVGEVMRNSKKLSSGEQFRMREATQESLAMTARTFFDTRPTALSEVNLFDLNNSPLVKNPMLKTSEEFSMCIRTIYLLRGLMKRFGVHTSAAKAWQPLARLALQNAGAADIRPPKTHFIADRVVEVLPK